jgi:Tfp pilus assembly protein PilX
MPQLSPPFGRAPNAARATAHRQRGAATLAVVMVLFFVVSLAAAYASRNLIFEQRTSANQQRSTVAIEAAEAAIEWAQVMLNSGRIDLDCTPTADTTFDNFRDRNLIVNTGSGVLSKRFTATGNFLWSACSFSGGVWVCRCPRTTELADAELPAGTAAFGVRFELQADKSGLIRIEVNGCNSYTAACVTAVAQGAAAGCRGTACAFLAVYPSLRTTPLAPVTAKGDVSGSALTVANSDGASGGVTVLAGGIIGGGVTSVGPAGTPGASLQRDNQTALGDLALQTPDCINCLFSSVLGVRPATYKRLGAVMRVDCSVACDAAAVNAALAVNRSNSVYLAGAGGLTIGNPTDIIGTAAAPVMLVMDGPFVMTAGAGTAARVHGAVYAASATIDGGAVEGAVVSEGNVSGSGTGEVLYDATALRRLRLIEGTFVRVSGTWRDFQ